MNIEDKLFELWSKYEDVAIHFNDLIMRLRTHALTGVAGVVTVAGLAINFGGKQAPAAEWTMVLFAISFLTIAWIALWILDVGYYNRLLIGAVNAICELEKATQTANPQDPLKSIILSTRVRSQASGHTYVVNIFYIAVLIGLLVGDALAYAKYSALPVQVSPDRLELKLDRVPDDTLQFSVGPTNPTTPLRTPVPSTTSPAVSPTASGTPVAAPPMPNTPPATPPATTPAASSTATPGAQPTTTQPPNP